MQKTYWVKFNSNTRKIILDVNPEINSENEALISGYRVTEEQGRILSDSLERFIKPMLPDVILACKRLFYACRECGHTTTKKESSKAWKGLCEYCFKEGEAERRRIYSREKEERDKLQYKLNLFTRFLATPQGKINSVPMEIIASNVRYWMAVKGKMYKPLSDSMGMTQPQFSAMFYNKFMKESTLNTIAEHIGVDIERLLEIPMGYKIDLHYGVPAWWFTSDMIYLKQALSEE